MRAREGFDRWLFLALGLLAFVSLALDVGLGLDSSKTRWLAALDLAIGIVFGLEILIALLRGGLRTMRERWFEVALLLVFATAIGLLRWLAPAEGMQELLRTWHVHSVTKLYLVAVQVFVLLDAAIHFLRGHEALLQASIRPERLFAAGFGFLIVVGTVLLLLPRCSASPERPIGLLEAFFTATSAVCVTGLTVRDTGLDFSLIGQTVIAFLFQVGGLGIVTFVALLSLASGRSFSVPQMVALRQLTSSESLSGVRRQVTTIVLTALLIESAGTAVLFWSGVAPGESLGMRLYWSGFHAISAFCNAGFGLASDSLTAWVSDPVVNLCIVVLIVVGGIGAPVVRDLAQYVGRAVALRRRAPEGDEAPVRRLPRLTAQTRITLRSTGVLLLIGFVGFFACELHGVLRGRPLSESLWASLFQSVTTRTAGFNTVPMDQLGDAALVLMIVLMAVGASPVSTGGGIKTTAIGVVLLTLRSMVTRRPIEAFGRSIPAAIVQTSISIVALYSIMAIVAIFLLSATDPDVDFADRAFEAVSALSTVGLSRGITASLSEAGQLVLCLAMFAGRVGPLTLAMTVLRSGISTSYRFPEEPMVLG